MAKDEERWESSYFTTKRIAYKLVIRILDMFGNWKLEIVR